MLKANWGVIIVGIGLLIVVCSVLLPSFFAYSRNPQLSGTTTQQYSNIIEPSRSQDIPFGVNTFGHFELQLVANSSLEAGIYPASDSGNIPFSINMTQDWGTNLAFNKTFNLYEGSWEILLRNPSRTESAVYDMNISRGMISGYPFPFVPKLLPFMILSGAVGSAVLGMGVYILRRNPIKVVLKIFGRLSWIIVVLPLLVLLDATITTVSVYFLRSFEFNPIVSSILSTGLWAVVSFYGSVAILLVGFSLVLLSYSIKFATLKNLEILTVAGFGILIWYESFVVTNDSLALYYSYIGQSSNSAILPLAMMVAFLPATACGYLIWKRNATAHLDVREIAT